MTQYYKALFRKYLNNQCNQEELEILLKFLKHAENFQEIEYELKQIWDQAGNDPPLEKPRINEAFEEIWEKRNSKHAGYEPYASGFTGRKFWYGLAASLILLMSIGIGLIIFQSSPGKVTYKSGYGEKQTITLPDQSQVVLNGNSTITYSEDESGEKEDIRKVILQGEAFFDVKNLASGQKFMVETSEGVKVEVLGTSFNVNTRRNETSVVLNSGKIRLNITDLEQDRQNILMKPGDLVAFSGQTKEVTRKKVKPSKYTSWKNDLLVFEKQSLRSIGHELEDVFGYDFRFGNDSIADLKYTGTISREKAELLPEIWEKAFDIQINQKGKVIRVNKN